MEKDKGFTAYREIRDRDGVQAVKPLGRRKNAVTKERFPSGAWEYKVVSPDGAVLASITFQTGRETADKVSNSDLLEIVRDRLDALNRGPNSSFRSYNCAQHVYEALFWAELPANRPEKLTEDD